MTKKVMVLALALAAPAAFGQTNMTAAGGAAAVNPAAAPVKTLRDEIKRDKGDIAAKTKAERAEHRELLAAEKAELAKVAQSVGTRAEKKAARLAVRTKYAGLMKEASRKSSYERKNLREDIVAKRGQIKKLRSS
jgi:hypothetical protein